MFRKSRNRRSFSISAAVAADMHPDSFTTASTTEMQHCSCSELALVFSARLMYGCNAAAKARGLPSATHSRGSVAQNTCSPSAYRTARGKEDMSLLVFSSFSSFSSSSASSCESIPSRIAPQSRRAVDTVSAKSPRASSAAASSSDGNTTRRRMATIGKVESRGSLACPTRLTPQYTSQSTATSCSARSATGSAASAPARRAGTAGRENHSSRKMRVTSSWIPTSSSRMRNARNRNASTPCLKSTLELRMQSCRMCITRLRTLTPTSEMRATMAA